MEKQMYQELLNLINRIDSHQDYIISVASCKRIKALLRKYEETLLFKPYSAYRSPSKMRVERHFLEMTTVEAFAIVNNLVMVLQKRDGMFFAHFRDTKVFWPNDSAWSHFDASGKSEEAAILEYATKLNGQLLMIPSGTVIRANFWG